MKVTKKHVIGMLIVCLIGLGSFMMNQDLWYAVTPLNEKGIQVKP